MLALISSMASPLETSQGTIARQIQPDHDHLTPESLGEVITLYVGAKRKKMIVHAKILCEGAKYFDSAFHSGFKKSASRKMHLPDDNGEAVANAIEYLYRGSIPMAALNDTAKIRRLYYLAEKWGMFTLMNTAMDQLLKLYVLDMSTSINKPGTTVINSIFKNTHEKSKLRKLCVALIISTMLFQPNGGESHLEKGDRFAENLSDCPEFFVELFRTQLSLAEQLRVAYGSKRSRVVFDTCFKASDFYVENPEKVCSDVVAEVAKRDASASEP